ncbi:MAG: YraN family protein [Clostridia bacterium]|nr:YraN family protein [Clostridia bacterium]
MRITQTDFYKKLLGRLGEKKAEKFLKRKRYKIIEKNYKTKFAECDLIALYANLLVFIEVKTRSSVAYGNPADAVDFNKQKKYVKLAEYFLACNNEYKNHSVRFDVIEILNDEINHIEGAFYADDL